MLSLAPLRYTIGLLEPGRVALSRAAIPAFYAMQRDRYGKVLASLGLELWSGTGGFYHWAKLPRGITAAQLNEKLFAHGAAILKGTDCDMARGGDASPLASFFRFSFGSLDPAAFDSDVKVLTEVLGELVAGAGAKPAVR